MQFIEDHDVDLGIRKVRRMRPAHHVIHAICALCRHELCKLRLCKHHHACLIVFSTLWCTRRRRICCADGLHFCCTHASE